MHFLRKESLSAFLFFFICLSKSYEFDKFQLLGPVGQRVGNTIQWLSVNKMHCAKASSVIHYSPSTTWNRSITGQTYINDTTATGIC